MSAEAAKWIAKYDEGVVTAIDSHGYPLSVRQTSLPYDAPTGTMKLVVPDSLDGLEGAASLLCHFHDEALWHLRAILVKGRVERRNGGWTFVTTSFEPPAPTWRALRRMSSAAGAYLARRGLTRPQVNWDAIDRLWKRAEAIRRA